jgi:ribosomal protein L3 glutamine methyltransferase
MTAPTHSAPADHRPTPSDPQLRTVRDWIRHAVSRFARSNLFYGHGHLDAFDEASHLVLRALALPLDRADFFLDAALTHLECERLNQLIERRVHDLVPTAYLLNEAWLQGYRFYVDERTIIPRSFIAELLHDGLEPWIDDPEAIGAVLDVCTGSACLAILSADLFPNAHVDAVDISADALAVARRNVEDYHLQARLGLHQSDLYTALGNARYDLILSNPPYVTDQAMADLPREYRHEPSLALAGGLDGLDLVETIVRQARRHLNPGGLLIVEIGDAREAMEARFADIPMTWLTTSAGDDMVFLIHEEDLPA